MPDRSFALSENTDLDAVAVIGSDQWAETTAPDVTELLKSVMRRNGVTGGICAGTVALARAGLFEGTAHTSNDPEWLTRILHGYAGSENYRRVSHAVADKRVVSAPGSAHGTFAIEFLRQLYPDKSAITDEMRALFAKEYSGTSG